MFPSRDGNIVKPCFAFFTTQHAVYLNRFDGSVFGDERGGALPTMRSRIEWNVESPIIGPSEYQISTYKEYPASLDVPETPLDLDHIFTNIGSGLFD